MSPRFIAEPPLPIKRSAIRKHFRRLLASLRFILWQIVVPFKSHPEKIDEISVVTQTMVVTEEQVKQSQWLFDQAAVRRVHLEQKAQSTFGLMLFLVPLLASLFVFFISKSPASHATLRIFAIALLCVSAVLLLLGFIAAVRAISVKSVQTLFVHSVIDHMGQFRRYEKGFHAGGLLYCAAMNEAMNDHIAQFVKGAHLLTATAVIGVAIAAVPASFVFSGLPSSPAEMKIVGAVPLEVSSPELSAVRDDVAGLKEDVGKALSNSLVANDGLKLLQDRVGKTDAQLRRMQRVPPSGPGKKVVSSSVK